MSSFSHSSASPPSAFLGLSRNHRHQRIAVFGIHPLFREECQARVMPLQSLPQNHPLLQVVPRIQWIMVKKLKRANSKLIM